MGKTSLCTHAVSGARIRRRFPYTYTRPSIYKGAHAVRDERNITVYVNFDARIRLCFPAPQLIFLRGHTGFGRNVHAIAGYGFVVKDYLS